jgi:hypothetical protein
VRGFIGEVFKTIHSWNEEGGVIPASVTRNGEREEIAGKGDDTWGLRGGEREGGGAGLG